jgi:hypothetical protein
MHSIYGGTDTIPGQCISSIYGCTDSSADNFYPLANMDDMSCKFAGCTDSTRPNHDHSANVDNGLCMPLFPGCCMDLSSLNCKEVNTVGSRAEERRREVRLPTLVRARPGAPTQAFLFRSGSGYLADLLAEGLSAADFLAAGLS